jgi:hypothetical protein
MINIKFAKHLEKLIQDNSPTILTAAAVVGTIATAWLTAKASFKAAEMLAESVSSEEAYPEAKLSTTDKVKVVWQEFVPPVAVGSASIAAMICANRISVRRAAALAAAYKLSEKNFEEYKKKIWEKWLGDKENQKAKDEIAQERVDKNPLGNRPVIVTGNGEVMCYDMPSDRYFKSSMETIRKAENDVNQQVLHDGRLPLAEFYRAIGLKPTSSSEEVGWTTECTEEDDGMLLEIVYSTTMTNDSQPCIAINYEVTPIRGYKRQT